MDIEEVIKSLNKFIKNFEEVQGMYKDDEVQAEIERQCYFEEVPYFEIKAVLAELDKKDKMINTILKDISYEVHKKICKGFCNCETADCIECRKQYYEKKAR